MAEKAAIQLTTGGPLKVPLDGVGGRRQMRWWLALIRFGRPHLKSLSMVVCLMLGGIALDLLKPWPMKLIVDQVLQNRPLPSSISWLIRVTGDGTRISLLAWLTAGTVLVFLAGQSVRMIRSYLEAGVGSRMVYDLGAKLFEHLQSLSLQYHGKRSKGDLVRRVITDSSCVRELIMWVLLPVLSSLISLVAMFAVMWKLDISMSLLALFVALPLGVFIKIFSKPMSDRTYKQQQLEGQMMALAEQTLSALPVVQAFGREEYQDRRYRELSSRTIKAALLTVASQLQFKVSTSGVTSVGTAVIMAVGGFHVLQGSLTVGTLLVFLSYLASLYTPLETLAYVSSGFASASARARRVLEVLETEEGVWDEPGAREVVWRGRGVEVKFEGVAFGYEAGRPILQEINIEAQPGETLALVGATGAGKSTLVSLIPRFFDAWEGRILFNGVDIREVKLSSLRSQVSLVLQEPFLLPLSIAENIAYGRPGASREELVEAARAANADEFIRGLPQGYETVLGERGASLSGGERQRLSIARALLKDAPVLILDEPTSSLDAGTEALLLEALERLMEGRTTFIIAHRLSTIRGADRILVMDRGRIIESGTHQELLAVRGAYCRLHRLQTGHFETSGVILNA
ncbi:MAG: ABC transporter ATP-binding protein [Desulfoferrobacter sp.]